MPQRGLHKFEVDGRQRLVDTPSNFKKTQKMFLDWRLILYQGGPGTAEADNGSWHVLCHLAGASGLFSNRDGNAGWAGITYDAGKGTYAATFSFTRDRQVATVRLDSEEGRAAMKGWLLRGYVEGASRGHILDRKAKDPGDPKQVDRRQDYDQPPSSKEDGGPVWEHWCTSRDIVTPSGLGTGMLRSYLTLVCLLGGRFAGTVARGRNDAEYGHLIQLRGLVRAGFIRPADAGWDIKPTPIPSRVENVLYEARPEDFLKAAAMLLRAAPQQPQYFMFSRKIQSFVPASFALKVVKA